MLEGEGGLVPRRIYDLIQIQFRILRLHLVFGFFTVLLSAFSDCKVMELNLSQLLCLLIILIEVYLII